MSDEMLKRENEEKKQEELVNLASEPLKVSRVVIDEATGTVTLTLATKEEIAEDERIKAERLIKEKEINGEQC